MFLILFVEPLLPLSVTAQSAHGLFVCVCVFSLRPAGRGGREGVSVAAPPAGGG